MVCTLEITSNISILLTPGYGLCTWSAMLSIHKDLFNIKKCFIPMSFLLLMLLSFHYDLPFFSDATFLWYRCMFLCLLSVLARSSDKCSPLLNPIIKRPMIRSEDVLATYDKNMNSAPVMAGILLRRMAFFLWTK